MTITADDITDFSDPTTRKIVAFIRSIGIEVLARPVEGKTFVPGISIVGGTLHADESRMKWPGDLLHEAGHLAVAEPEKRNDILVDIGNNPGEEIAAIAWSYAASVYLEIDPAVVFHPEGYKGDSEWLIETFSKGETFGVPLLQYYGLCREKGESEYPAMQKWMR
ncbi:MAG: hypothetical protein FD123_2965 [Bacteroidetes bacterium]|nr:MAG: hypothetical protein FD123_2965 [Bacteroidota bacterium]